MQHFVALVATAVSWCHARCIAVSEHVYDGFGAWPTYPPAYPLYPGRAVQVLNGTWHFAFLGDVSLVPEIPNPPKWHRVSVPDAFDMRSDRPRCQECWPQEGGETECLRCCDRSLGYHGDPSCWADRWGFEDGVWKFESGVPQSVRFERCCGEDPLRSRRGVGAYRVELETPPMRAALLILAGCVLRCLVAVDGEFLDDHAGLSPFALEVPATALDRRVIVVLADNRFNHKTHPVHHSRYDWYQAGGLVRNVQFHVLPTSAPLFLEAVEVFPLSSRNVDVVVRPSAAAINQLSLSYRWLFDDSAGGQSCQVSDAWGELHPGLGLRNIEVPEARPWTPRPGGPPSLHRLKVALLESSQVLDCIEVRFGLRVVQAKGRQIIVNGEPLRLFGFNRHDMADSPVLAYEDLVRDIELLVSSGMNFVRGAHYAQDQRFLDLCDTYGILVWEEVLGWQNSVAEFSDDTFMLQMLSMASELTAASMNHPSVILLGFFNEGDSFDDSEATTGAYQAMAARLRAHARSTRLISYGSNHREHDRQLEVVDVCSFHLYAAWYPTTQAVDYQQVEQIPLVWEFYGRWVEEHFPNKPLLATEAGAGGLFGFRGSMERKWTEEYQSLVLQMHLLSVLQSNLIVGISLWQLADSPIDRRVSSEAHRPRALNNKGVVSLHRQKKIAFHSIKRMMELGRNHSGATG